MVEVHESLHIMKEYPMNIGDFNVVMKNNKTFLFEYTHE
jgi:hypothetical protein